jgi:hypothetical protein
MVSPNMGVITPRKQLVAFPCFATLSDSIVIITVRYVAALDSRAKAVEIVSTANERCLCIKSAIDQDYPLP